MTETLTIDRIVATAPGDANGSATRIDRIVHRVAEERLDRVLGAQRLAPDGEWCIRRVAVSASLDLLRPDPSVEEALAQAIINAISAAVHGPDVVHYPRPVDALADLVASVSLGQFDRAWAWMRIGLLGDVNEIERDPVGCVLDVLAIHPPDALSALTRALTSVGFAPLHRFFTESGWIRLVHIVIGAHVDVTIRMSIEALIRGGFDSPQATADIVRASRLADSTRIIATARASRLRFDEQTSRALAVLAVAESEPAVLQRSDVAPVCLTVARLLAGTVQSVLETPRAAVKSSESREMDTTTAGDITEHAGLLFLLNVACDAAMPDALFDDPILDGIPASELLARVGLALVPAPDDDPAVLAFAGSDAKRLWFGWSKKAVSPNVLERIEAHAYAWATATAVRFGRTADPLEVMAQLTRRTGRIEREQGWIDVHLDLAQVDVDLRIAGLDLDPGWVPWLGSVVRFCYA